MSGVPSEPDLAPLRRRALIAAATGSVAFVALTLMAGPLAMTRAATAYLVAYQAVLAVPMGCLVLLMMQYLTGGAWGVLLRPVLEAASRTLWLMAFLALPILGAFFLGDRSPYPWARPLDRVATGSALEEMRAKAWLLNPPFVAGRTAAYFAVWLLLSVLLRRRSARWIAGDAHAGGSLPTISGPGLVAYGVTISLAAIDWVMSLEPAWRSSAYPALFAVGQIASGFAFATIAAVLLSRHAPLSAHVTEKHLRDLGGLLLAFVMLWAYVAFSQFLLIWVGNLPDEAFYYFKRLRGGWQWIGIGLIALHFALPFLVLLFRRAKENGSVLMGVAMLVLVMRFVDAVWWIEAAFPHRGSPRFWLLDTSAFAALGGAWAWWFLGVLARTDLVPVRGPDQCETGGPHA